MKTNVMFGLLALVVFGACHRVKDGAKDAINKTGEAVGKAGAEFSDGISEGVKKAMQCQLILTDELTKQGLRTGKLNFTSQKDASDNGLAVYMIFEKDFSNTIQVKAFDEKGLEYGRAAALVKGKKGVASYVDFVFDKRVNLEAKSKFEMK
jgi:hypothetical protein